ncbi:MAG: hypothetical protein GQ574_08240 [Crocinitomix sp.]|nr:hypothetical protein [Crocinitomix sp.]
MKNIIVLSVLFLAAACGNQKETMQEKEATEQEIETVTEETTENYRVVGIVHVSETDCLLYIETKLKDSTVNMYPMNLDEKYMRDGMKLKFAYTLSRGAQPENCDIDMVVAMSDVTLMR